MTTRIMVVLLLRFLTSDVLEVLDRIRGGDEPSRAWVRTAKKIISYYYEHTTAAPLVWLDIVKNEILQESQKTNSAGCGPILPF